MVKDKKAKELLEILKIANQVAKIKEDICKLEEMIYKPLK